MSDLPPGTQFKALIDMPDFDVMAGDLVVKLNSGLYQPPGFPNRYISMDEVEGNSRFTPA